MDIRAKNTFGEPLLPSDEKERLAKLYGYKIVNNYERSGIFQHVASMAAHIFKVPIALVNFVDEKEVVSNANVGLEPGIQVPRQISLCSLAILQDEVTVFENAAMEPCLLNNPLVHGEFGLRFYAAAPLTTPDGYKIGAIAIADKEPRVFSKADAQILHGLSVIVIEELEQGLLLTSQ